VHFVQQVLPVPLVLFPEQGQPVPELPVLVQLALLVLPVQWALLTWLVQLVQLELLVWPVLVLLV
jgi:hypothetical protein